MLFTIVTAVHAPPSSPMRAIGHVLLRAAKQSVALRGTTFFGVAAAAFILFALLIRTYRREGWNGFRAHLVGDLGYTAAASAAIWFLLMLWFTPAEIYDEHAALLRRIAALRTENARQQSDLNSATNAASQALTTQKGQLEAQILPLQQQLFQATHSLNVTWPATSNAAELADAFRSWRSAIGPTAPCRIELTATSDTQEIALTTSRFAVMGSDCPAFGPSDPSGDAEAEKQATMGMVPKTVVVHIAHGVPGDVNLFYGLQQLFRVKRAYDVPPGKPTNFVWLQFGSGTKWNSEIR